MKKEEITIRVTPENVNLYLDVLKSYGEPVNTELNNDLLDLYPVMYICVCKSTGEWGVFYTGEDDQDVLNKRTIDWGLKDLFYFLTEEILDKRGERIEDLLEAENKLDKARFRLYGKILGYGDRGRWSLSSLSEEKTEDTKYVIGDGEGGFAEVELEKDMVVVKLPGGSFQPIKRSDLFKVVKA